MTFLAACSVDSNVSSMCWNAKTDGNQEMTSTEFIILFVAFMFVLAIGTYLYDWYVRRQERKREEAKEAAKSKP